MASSLDSVRIALGIFLRGGNYTPLWAAVMSATDTVDSDLNVTVDEREWYDELYDAVYMGADDPLDEESARLGVVGAAELRVQIRAMRLDRFDSSDPPTGV